MSTPKLNTVDGIRLCDACLDGEGDMCHTPGCVMIRRRCPDLPLRDDIILGGGTIASDGSGELTLRRERDALLAAKGELVEALRSLMKEKGALDGSSACDTNAESLAREALAKHGGDL